MHSTQSLSLTAMMLAGWGALLILHVGVLQVAGQDPPGTLASPPLLLAEGRVAILATTDLKEFDSQPPAVQRLITAALRLTKLGLGYHYGSDDPASGGMDCSGTIYYLLQNAGIHDAPRDSGEIYRWVWMQGRILPVVSSNPGTFELGRLKPGDLLFWANTYKVTRDPPISHVMIYLGVNRATGRRVMVGASDGRRFNDISRDGVSVFDFELPRARGGGVAGTEDAPRFVGYGSIPGLDATAAKTQP